jgi:hypothetical protein
MLGAAHLQCPPATPLPLNILGNPTTCQGLIQPILRIADLKHILLN